MDKSSSSVFLGFITFCLVTIFWKFMTSLTARFCAAIDLPNSILNICISDYISLQQPYVSPVLIV